MIRKRINPHLYFLILFIVNCNTEKVLFSDAATIYQEPNELSPVIRYFGGKEKITDYGVYENDNTKCKSWNKVKLKDYQPGYVPSDYVFDKEDLDKLGTKTFPHVKAIVKEDSINIINDKTNELITKIENSAEKVELNYSKQKNRYLYISYLTGSKPKFQIFDLEKLKFFIDLENVNINEPQLADLEDVSPLGIYIVIDVGTSSFRDKHIINTINKNQFILTGIKSAYKWISPRSFEYWDTPQKDETELEIYKKQEDGQPELILQEKRYWCNGKTIRTTEIEYIKTESL